MMFFYYVYVDREGSFGLELSDLGVLEVLGLDELFWRWEVSVEYICNLFVIFCEVLF